MAWLLTDGVINTSDWAGLVWCTIDISFLLSRYRRFCLLSFCFSPCLLCLLCAKSSDTLFWAKILILVADTRPSRNLELRKRNETWKLETTACDADYNYWFRRIHNDVTIQKLQRDDLSPSFNVPGLQSWAGKVSRPLVPFPFKGTFVFSLRSDSWFLVVLIKIK